MVPLLLMPKYITAHLAVFSDTSIDQQTCRSLSSLLSVSRLVAAALTPALASTGFAAVLQRDDAPSSSAPAPSASPSIRPPGIVEFGNTSTVPDKCKDACSPWLQTLDNNGTCLSYLDVASNGDGKGFDDDYLGLNCKNKESGKVASLQLLCNVSLDRLVRSPPLKGVCVLMLSTSTSSPPADTASSRTRSAGSSKMASRSSQAHATSGERLCLPTSRV